MLKQVKEQLQETRVVADTEVTADWRTRAGHEMRRRQAQQEVPALEQKFAREFKTVGFPVFVSGVGADEFVGLAAETAEAVVVDYKKALSDIYSNVKASIGHNHEFTPNTFTILLREVRQLGADLGLTSIASPNFDGVEYVKDDEAVDSLVSTYLQKYFGAELIAPALEREALKQALTLPCESPVVPVLLLGVPVKLQEEVGQKMFSGKYIAVETNEEVTEEDVTAAFKTIKITLKQ